MELLIEKFRTTRDLLKVEIGKNCRVTSALLYRWFWAARCGPQCLQETPEFLIHASPMMAIYGSAAAGLDEYCQNGARGAG